MKLLSYLFALVCGISSTKESSLFGILHGNHGSTMAMAFSTPHQQVGSLLRSKPSFRDNPPYMESKHDIKSQSPFLMRKRIREKLNLTLMKANEGSSEKSESDSDTILKYMPIITPLLLVYVSNQWSRYSITYLVNFGISPVENENAYFTAMNVDIGFTEAQYGALASLAFTALFAFASLIAGQLADKLSIKQKINITTYSAVGWSLFTILTALSHSYSEVLIERICMGLACAASTPLAYTLLRDSIPATQSSLANSIYGSGIYVGGALSSLSILFDNQLGWRNTLIIIAIYGFVSAGIANLALSSNPDINDAIKKIDNGNKEEIQNGENDEAETNNITLIDDAKIILSSPRVRWIFASSFVRFCSGLCIGIWAAPYFRSAFPDDAASYAIINAFIVSICGVTSGVLGGYLADKVASSSNGKDSASRLWIPVIGSALAVPTFYYTVHAPSFEMAMIGLASEYLVAECWFGPTVSVLLQSTDANKGGTAQGMFTLTGALGNLSPSVLGILYSASSSSGDSGELANLLTYFVCGGYLLSSVGFFVAATTSNEPSVRLNSS